MKRALLIFCALALVGPVFAQETTPPKLTPEQEQRLLKLKMDEEAKRKRAIQSSVDEGIPVQLGTIGGFRGARSNTIVGYGLVVGLEGTGDTKAIPITSQAMANALAKWGSMMDANGFKSKNIAIVSITAELPPFAAPGRRIDITVQSLGDAKSLQGGTLLPTPLGVMGDSTQTFAMASGPISIGGYNISAGGNSVRKNHSTVGMVPNGGDVQKSVPTQVLFDDNKIFFDLEEPDFTTAQRSATRIQEAFPDFTVVAQDAVSISIQIPVGMNPVLAMSQIENLSVFAPTPATVVINERTGTIVIGGKVKLGAAVIAHGSLRIRIDTEVLISQPAPLSQGQTKVEKIPVINAEETPTQIAVVAPNATLDDLAKLLQGLNVSARDIIAILQALAEQGALKARIKVQ